MAFSYLGDIGGATNKTSGTTISTTVTANVPVGSLIVVMTAADYQSATTPLTTFSDSVGNTYTVRAQRFNGTGANAGISGAIGVAMVTTPLVSGSTTITATLSVAATAKVIEVFAFTGISTVLSSAINGANGTGTAPAVTSNAVAANDLVLGLALYENTGAVSALDADTLNGSWVQLANAFTTGGAATSNVALSGQYKRPTASGAQTFNNTLAASSVWSASIVVLKPTVERTGTQAGTGTSSATGLVTRPRTATSSGTGTSTATRLIIDLRTASSSGTGTSTASRVVTRSRTASSAGTGTSTAAGARAVLRSATSAGTGSSSATRVFFRARTATSSGLGSSSATRNVIRARTATSSGVGLFDSTGLVTRRRTATSTGAGTSTTTSFRTSIRTATSSGTSTSTAVVAKLVVRVATAVGVGTQNALSERIFVIPVPLGPRPFRKHFYPPPSKPVTRGKPLQPPRVKW